MAKQSLNLPYILLTGIILAGIVSVFMVLRPQYAAWQVTRDQLTQVQDKIVERETFLLNIDRKKAELQGEQIHEKQLAVILPTDEALDDVARLLHKMSEATGVIISRINNGGDGERARIRALRARGEIGDIPANVEPVSVELQIAGNYQQLRQFIDRIEKSPRIMDIVSLQITRNNENAELLNVILQLRMYEHEQEIITNG